MSVCVYVRVRVCARTRVRTRAFVCACARVRVFLHFGRQVCPGVCEFDVRACVCVLCVCGTSVCARPAAVRALMRHGGHVRYL